MDGVLSYVTRYKNPEYTGENRCVQCTVVNVGIVAVVSAVAAAYMLLSGWGELAAPVVVGFAAVSTASIYFKGYLVPGTPTLTRRYMPQRLLAAFGKTESSEPGPAPDDIDIEQLFVSNGILQPCQDGADLCLTEEFARRWREEIEAIREVEIDRDRLLGLLGLSADDVRFEEYPTAFRMRVDGRSIGKWESQEAFYADAAAAELLEDRLPKWPRLDAVQRGELLNGLRLFLTRCPGCDAPLSLDMDRVESCCNSREVLALSCEECGARVFESDQTGH
jgi:hypothetical protein